MHRARGAEQTADGSAIRYANDVDIGINGIVYFSDASTRFGAKANGGTLADPGPGGALRERAAAAI